MNNEQWTDQDRHASGQRKVFKGLSRFTLHAKRLDFKITQVVQLCINSKAVLMKQACWSFYYASCIEWGREGKGREGRSYIEHAGGFHH